jgi:hypothetical protein
MTATPKPNSPPDAMIETGALNDIAAMMSEFVDNWPQPKRFATALKLIAKTIRAALDPPLGEARDTWEVRPCKDRLGNVSSWDICLPTEPDATGVAVVASVYSGEAVANEIVALWNTRAMQAAPEGDDALREAICSPAYALAFVLFGERDVFANADRVVAAAKKAGVRIARLLSAAPDGDDAESLDRVAWAIAGVENKGCPNWGSFSPREYGVFIDMARAAIAALSAPLVDRGMVGPWEAVLALTKAADEAAEWITNARELARGEGTISSLPMGKGEAAGRRGEREVRNLRAAIRKARAALARADAPKVEMDK